jgi:hypothetical protein
VGQALDAWSWYWIGVEAVVLFMLTGFWLASSGVYRVGFETLGGALAFAMLGMPALGRQCRRYAVAQVRAIVADPARAATVRQAIAEATGAPAWRLAS